VSTARLSRRSLLAGAAAIPLGVAGIARAAGKPMRVLGVSAQNDLGPVNPVTREPLPGTRWPLPGWAAWAASRDGKQVLVWNYATGGHVATVDAASLRQARPFAAGVSTLKGSALSWPVGDRLMLARDDRYGRQGGATRIQAVDPTRGQILSHQELPAHMAAWAPRRQGLLIALTQEEHESGGLLASVDFSGKSYVHSGEALDATVFDNQPGGHEPSAGLALGPGERRALLVTSSSLLAIELPSGAMFRLAAGPGLPVQQLEWLDGRHVLLAAQESAAVPAALSIVDSQSGTRRAIGSGSPGSRVVTAPGRIVIARPAGGISVLTAGGASLAHHRTRTPLFLLQRAGHYVMAQPQDQMEAAGRRIVVDVRSGALVLDRVFDHAPSIIVTAP
jgi:hypothetical protein